MMAEIRMTVDLEHIFYLISREVKAPAISIALSIAVTCLNKIAERAIEIGDTVIIAELQTLGIINDGKGEDVDHHG